MEPEDWVVLQPVIRVEANTVLSHWGCIAGMELGDCKATHAAPPSHAAVAG